MDKFHKSFLLERLTVIDVPRSNHETQEFSTFVAYQMQFESEKPTHGTVTSLCHSLERLMDMDSLVFTYPQRSAVHEADACTFSPKPLLDEQSQWDGHFFFLFNKTVMGNDLMEEMAHMFADFFLIKCFRQRYSES